MADDPHVQNHVKDDKKSKETTLQIPGQETHDSEILIQELDT